MNPSTPHWHSRRWSTTRVLPLWRGALTEVERRRLPSIPSFQGGLGKSFDAKGLSRHVPAEDHGRRSSRNPGSRGAIPGCRSARLMTAAWRKPARGGRCSRGLWRRWWRRTGPLAAENSRSSSHWRSSSDVSCPKAGRAVNRHRRGRSRRCLTSGRLPQQCHGA